LFYSIKECLPLFTLSGTIIQGHSVVGNSMVILYDASDDLVALDTTYTTETGKYLFMTEKGIKTILAFPTSDEFVPTYFGNKYNEVEAVKLNFDTNVGAADIRLVSSNGIAEIDLFEMMAYPMPAGNTLYVELPSSVKANAVSLKDITGKSVFDDIELIENKAVLNFSHLPKGLYILKIKGNDGVTNRLITKK